MKRLMKPVRVVAWNDGEGVWTPVRFQMETEPAEYEVVKVEKVLDCIEEKIAGQRVLNYQCRSTVAARVRRYELRYETSTCRWYLSKW